MGNGCTICSSRVAPMGIDARVHNHQTIGPKEIRNGCCLLYPGVPSENDRYTCPILAIHTWDKSVENEKTEMGVLHAVGINGGLMGTKHTTMISNANERVEFKVGIDQKIQMLPVEDILSIEVFSEVKKAVEQRKGVSIVEAPPEDLTCCQKFRRRLCCCCNEKRPAPEFRTKMTQKQNATRTITVTIKHLRHGLVHTPSNVRVLSNKQQNEFYQQQLHLETIQFYYLSNEIFDETEYKIQLQESETLARIVMQLKAMNNHYPDESQLQKIIQQHHSHYFGQVLNTDIAILTGDAAVTATTVKTVID